jgi:hypothetical protein
VKVLKQGFEYDGRIFDLLTALTKRITGQQGGPPNGLPIPLRRRFDSMLFQNVADRAG